MGRCQTTDVDDNYQKNRSYGDAHLEQAITILEDLFGPIRVGNTHEDIRLGADLLTTDGATTFGLRVRDKRYLRYANEITIRSGHPKSTNCELLKLLEGKPDWVLYAFSDQGNLIRWSLVNCKILQRALKENTFPVKTNKDHTRFMTVPLLLLNDRYPGLILVQG